MRLKHLSVRIITCGLIEGRLNLPYNNGAKMPPRESRNLELDIEFEFEFEFEFELEFEFEFELRIEIFSK